MKITLLEIRLQNVEANITPKIPDEQSTNSSESIASEHNSRSSKSGQSAPPSYEKLMANPDNIEKA